MNVIKFCQYKAIMEKNATYMQQTISVNACQNSLGQAVDAACKVLGHHTVLHRLHTDLF